jgi:hypothetical protein
MVDYRGYGDSEGLPSEPGLMLDADAVSGRCLPPSPTPCTGVHDRCTLLCCPTSCGVCARVLVNRISACPGPLVPPLAPGDGVRAVWKEPRHLPEEGSPRPHIAVAPYWSGLVSLLTWPLCLCASVCVRVSVCV